MPRAVICHKSEYLDAWAKLSPNKGKGEEAYFFCQQDGSPCRYASIRKQFNLALKKARIPWPKKKGIHFLRHLFSTRTMHWPNPIKFYWMGWSNSKSIEQTYTHVSYKDCTKQYFEMLKEEDNPFFVGEKPFWEDKYDDILIERMKTKPAFRKLLVEISEELST